MAVQALVPQATSTTTFDRRALFYELDGRVRNIEQRWKATWLELSNLCIAIQDQELWREGGYDSFGQWLVGACPMCRSYAYAALGARKALSDVTEEDLKQIPLGNAVILQRTPRKRRSKDLIEQAKRQPPAEFLQTVVDKVPESHLEPLLVHKFRLSKSASKVLRSGLDMWRLLNDDPDAHVEAALEGLVADYMLTHQSELEQKLAQSERLVRRERA